MKKTLVLFFAIVVCASLSWGQTPFTATIQVGDGITTYDLVLGVDAGATYGVDAAFGEAETPPVPPDGPFDARFVSPVADPTGFGEGRIIDIRQLVTDCQLDIFKIKFQPSTEANGTIIISWPDLSTFGCEGWKIVNALGGSPTFSVNMLDQNTVTFNTEDVSSPLYIVKGDGAEYRTFTVDALAKDGSVDSKGKKTYHKAYKATSNQVEFCATFMNTDTAAVTYLHVEFKTPLDSASMSVTQFATWTPVKVGKYDKWNFSGGSVVPGDSVVICGYGVKSGTKVQFASWYWYKMVNGKPVVTHTGKKKTATFTKNIVRLPMPNSINAGEKLFAQSHPKGSPLVIGTTARTDTVKTVSLAKYGDVLKSLAKNPGKVGKERYHDSLPTYLNSFDDTKKGYRMGAAIKKGLTNLPPDKHRNKLFGEALALALNIDFSATTPAITPAGLGALQVSDATSLFNGMTVSEVLAATNYFLSYNTHPVLTTATAADFADMCAAINAAFYGDMDTTSWSGATVILNGAKSLADIGGWLVRTTTFAGQNSADVVTANQPYTYSLEQNYPNPFNPTTNIEFSLANDGFVTVKIFNLLGQEVATLLNNEEYSAGIQSLEFNASNLPSGVYFYRINAKNANGVEMFQDVKKMVLLK